MLKVTRSVPTTLQGVEVIYKKPDPLKARNKHKKNKTIFFPFLNFGNVNQDRMA